MEKHLQNGELNIELQKFDMAAFLLEKPVSTLLTGLSAFIIKFIVPNFIIERYVINLLPVFQLSNQSNSTPFSILNTLQF